MKITPQDIIDREFKVKFRGFDMAEVDTFLEEVAENFFKLSEENTLLNEKILALQEDIESGKRVGPQAQMELPAEIGNFLEELKQDTAAISSELVALKQDHSTFVSLEKTVKEAMAAQQKSAASTPPRDQTEIAALKETLHELKSGTETINTELKGLKEVFESFTSLKNDLEATLSTIGETSPVIPPQTEAGSDTLAKTLVELRRETEKTNNELAALKKELGSIKQIREETKGELQELLKSHFNDFEEKLSKSSPASAKAVQEPNLSAAGEKKELLAAAIIEEEPATKKKESRLPDFTEQDTASDDELEFLSEDDILDVDKLRDVFQSVLDDSVSDTPNSREDDDESSSDLLFLEDSIFDEEHEPEVTFSLEGGNGGMKQEKTK